MMCVTMRLIFVSSAECHPNDEVFVGLCGSLLELASVTEDQMQQIILSPGLSELSYFEESHAFTENRDILRNVCKMLIKEVW